MLRSHRIALLDPSLRVMQSFPFIWPLAASSDAERSRLQLHLSLTTGYRCAANCMARNQRHKILCNFNDWMYTRSRSDKQGADASAGARDLSGLLCRARLQVCFGNIHPSRPPFLVGLAYSLAWPIRVSGVPTERINGGCRCKQGGGWPNCFSSLCLIFPYPTYWKTATSCKQHLYAPVASTPQKHANVPARLPSPARMGHCSGNLLSRVVVCMPILFCRGQVAELVLAYTISQEPPRLVCSSLQKTALHTLLCS